MKNSNYYLVLEYRHGDFMPIDINLLNKSNINFNEIKSIDNFTKKYSKEEIIDLIKENNLVPKEYLNGDLLIINDKKYRYQLLTKNDSFALDTFIIDNISNKVVMNKLVNIYQKYTKENIDLLKKTINSQNIKDTLDVLLSLDYEILRNIYVYLANNN